MKKSETSKKIRGLCVAVVLAAASAAGPALADDVASVAPASEPARASFDKFAQSWMDKVQRIAAEQKPAVHSGTSNTVVTYRDYASKFDVELRPTGHATAPYVGILRYSEQVFSCRDIGADDCTLSSQIPITEIFRYQNGRWVY